MLLLAVRFKLRERLVDIQNGVEGRHNLVKQKHHGHNVDLVAHHVHHECSHRKSGHRTLGRFHGSIVQYFLPIYGAIGRASVICCEGAANWLKVLRIRVSLIVTNDELSDGGGHRMLLATPEKSLDVFSNTVRCCRVFRMHDA